MFIILKCRKGVCGKVRVCGEVCGMVRMCAEVCGTVRVW